MLAHLLTFFGQILFHCLLGLLNLGLLEARHLILLVARPALDGKGTFVEFHIFSGIPGLFLENLREFQIFINPMINFTLVSSVCHCIREDYLYE